MRAESWQWVGLPAGRERHGDPDASKKKLDVSGIFAFAIASSDQDPMRFRTALIRRSEGEASSEMNLETKVRKTMRASLIFLFAWLMSAWSPARADESYYLYLPPIVGSVSLPDYPGLIPIDSFGFGVSNGGKGIEYLHVTRPIDSTSPAFFLALVSDEHFAIGDVLGYESGATEPYLTFQMVDAIVSSDTKGGHFPTESVSLAFESGGYVQAVPEPSTSALMLFGFLAMAGVAVKRRLSAGRFGGVRAIDAFA